MSSSVRNVLSPSESGSTSGALTPTSSQDESLHSPNGLSTLPHPASPPPSLERALSTLDINCANVVTVSPPPVSDGTTPSILARFEELQLERGSPAADRRASLSSGLHYGGPSRSTQRSSSRRPVQRHEQDQEELPHSRFYGHDFQNGLTQAKDLARRLADTLSTCDLHTDESSSIHALYTQAIDASRYSGPQHWKIALVGDSGQGKSSLINSLLDARGLARASNRGGACTCTVTEYHYHDSLAYNIEVVYFQKNQLLNQFKEHLRAFKRFHLHSTEDTGERQDLERASSVAWDTFQAAFRSQGLLTEAYLQQEDEQTVLSNMSSWIDQFAPEGYHYPCSDILVRLTSELPGANIAASWPYIERVDVFLRANILSRGLILVDLPGLHDTNSARRMITERYVVNCNEVFAIANIGRATTDAGVKAVVDLATRTRRRYVGIVCTKSEDTNSEEAERDLTGTALTSFRTLRQNLLRCEERLQSVSDELLDGMSSDQELDVHRRRRSIETEQRAHEFELQQHLVTVRNTRVIADLRQTYQPTVQHVFCVSNRTYWRMRDEEQEAALQWLQLSGIITLRRHCLGLVAEHQLQDASAFMRELIPNLVSSTDLWVQSGSGQITADTRAQARQASQETERILQRELVSAFAQNNNILSALKGEFDASLRSRFTIDSDERFRVLAERAARSWDAWHHASYAAFCRHSGDYTTAAVGCHCWNKEIIEGMTGDMSQPWRQFCRYTDTFFQRRHGALELCFGQALDPIQAIDLAVPDRESFDSVQTLITTLVQRKTLLRTETLGIVSEYATALARLGNVDFLSGISASFIGQHMEDAYQEAALDCGKWAGVTKRRQALIKRKVTDPHLFYTIRDKLEAQFQALTGNAAQKVRDANRKHFLAMRSALDTLRNENVVLEAERNPEFRERVRQQVVDAQRSIQDIAAVLQAAE